MEDPDYTFIFKSDKIIVYAVPSITDASHYCVIHIDDITPKSFGFFHIPTKYKKIVVNRKAKESEVLKDVVKGSTSIKDASSKVTKYLKDNGIQYKNLKS